MARKPKETAPKEIKSDKPHDKPADKLDEKNAPQNFDQYRGGNH